jgi:hypothetical protein
LAWSFEVSYDAGEVLERQGGLVELPVVQSSIRILKFLPLGLGHVEGVNGLYVWDSLLALLLEELDSSPKVDSEGDDRVDVGRCHVSKWMLLGEIPC